MLTLNSCETLKPQTIEVKPTYPEPAIATFEIKDMVAILEYSEDVNKAPWLYIMELHELIVDTQIWYAEFIDQNPAPNDPID